MTKVLTVHRRHLTLLSALCCLNLILPGGMQAQETSQSVQEETESATTETTDAAPEQTVDTDDSSQPEPQLPAASADVTLDFLGELEAIPGDTVYYSFIFTNAGPDTADGVRVTTNIPAGLYFDAIESDSVCRQVGDDVICGDFSLGPAGGQIVFLAFTVPESYDQCGSYSVIATLQSDTEDPRTADNTKTIQTSVYCGEETPVSSPLQRLGAGSTTEVVSDGTHGKAGPFTYVCTDGLLHLARHSARRSDLYTVNTRSGVSTLLQTFREDLHSLATDSSGTIYALRQNLHDTTEVLATLHSDQTVTTIGPTGIPGRTVALTFAASGTLYALQEEIDLLSTISTASGAAMAVDVLQNIDVKGGDMVINPEHELIYMRQSGDIYRLDLHNLDQPAQLSGTLPAEGRSYASLTWFDGYYYAWDHTADDLYRFQLDPFAYIIVNRNSGPFGPGDGASCPTAAIEETPETEESNSTGALIEDIKTDITPATATGAIDTIPATASGAIEGIPADGSGAVEIQSIDKNASTGSVTEMPESKAAAGALLEDSAENTTDDLPAKQEPGRTLVDEEQSALSEADLFKEELESSLGDILDQVTEPATVVPGIEELESVSIPFHPKIRVPQLGPSATTHETIIQACQAGQLVMREDNRPYNCRRYLYTD